MPIQNCWSKGSVVLCTARVSGTRINRHFLLKVLSLHMNYLTIPATDQSSLAEDYLKAPARDQSMIQKLPKT
jgi:hypothetical protein